MTRPSSRERAKQFAKILRKDSTPPDYNYLREIFRCLRKEFEIDVNPAPKRLPIVPTDEEIKLYYDAVWQSRNMQHMVMIKTLLYTGARVSELVHIRLGDVDLDRCQIRINQGKGKKDRVVPFPHGFRETLALHIQTIRRTHGTHLFISSRKKPYSDRGIRKILKHYTEHKLKHGA